MRHSFAVLIALAAASQCDAQIIRPRFQLSTPSTWVSVSGALENGLTVRDGATASLWEFGNGYPLGVSIEHAMSPLFTAGVRASTGMIPLHYTGPATSVEADARISQFLAVVHAANNQPFHTVFEGSAGVTYYSDFRARSDNTKLAPLTGDMDFTFTFGYGAGIALNPRMMLDVVQDVVTTVHQRDGLSASDDTTNRFVTTRLMLRVGLGG